MFNSFYIKLAWANLRRDKRTYIPHIIATAVISAVYMLIASIMLDNSLKNAPSGETAQSAFVFGIVVFTLFAFFFMAYINNFLVGRRNKEFGLYAVLGLEKRHVAKVLLWENIFTVGLGVIFGILLANIFGRLVFMVLLKLIDVAGDSRLALSINSYVITIAFFAAIIAATSIYNGIRIRLANPLELMHRQKKGDKDSKFIWPATVVGIVTLCVAYYLAWTQSNAAVAIGMFFPLVIAVIIATYLIFSSASIAILKALRANKRFYYRPGSFIATGGMIQRMRQSANSLATICILATMLTVTISCTLSLYIGKEDVLYNSFPDDVRIDAWIINHEELTEEEALAQNIDADELFSKNVAAVKPAVIQSARQSIFKAYAENGIILTDEDIGIDENYYYGDNQVFIKVLGNRSDVTQQTGLNIVKRLSELNNKPLAEIIGDAPVGVGVTWHISNIYAERQYGFGIYGGLLFLGIFFGLLFLVVTVLIIYFKQISEGYEDKARFDIMQKVGMDDKLVRSTINVQVLMVFFIPLVINLLHMIFASKIISVMLNVFNLNNYPLVMQCVWATCGVFTVLYIAVYALTARVYYKIVRW